MLVCKFKSLLNPQRERMAEGWLLTGVFPSPHGAFPWYPCSGPALWKPSGEKGVMWAGSQCHCQHLQAKMVPSGLRKPGVSSVKSSWTPPSTGDPWGPDLLQLQGFSAKLYPNRKCSVLESPQVLEFFFPIGLNLISTNTLKGAFCAHRVHRTTGDETEELPQVLYRNH